MQSSQKARSRIWLAATVLFVAWVLYRPLVEVFVDHAWFGAVGYPQVFDARVFSRIGLWTGGAAVTTLFLIGNLGFATREANLHFGRLAKLVADKGLTADQTGRTFRLAVGCWAVFASLAVAGRISTHWLEILTSLHAVPFNEVDPVFGQDIGFYVFTLPVLELGRSVFAMLLVLTLLPMLGFYLLRDVVLAKGRVTSRGLRHLAILLSTWFLTVAADWYLDRFEFLFAHRGAVWGASYADIHAAMPAALVMTGVSVVVAIMLLFAAARSSSRPVVLAVATYGIAFVIAKAWPTLMHDYVVKPSELDKERIYLEQSITSTRQAYQLDSIEVQPFEAEPGLTMEELQAHPETVDNIRIWDHRPLLQTFAQIQEIRLYYDFHDVDIDRYEIDGELRQVMLSAREFNVENLTAGARGWINDHFSYTHGYGLTMSPVNEVTTEGLPELWVQDIPPTSSVGVEIDNPAIYFGELTDDYVFVRTGVEEFDYPDGESNVSTTYDGQAGIELSGARKALFALYYANLDFMLSSYLTADSRILLRRNVKDRVTHVAPFLKLDQDPYIVISEGRLVWMMDAYTTTDRYPYSEPVREGHFNYIRNAVKVVVDAYDGTVDLYVADETDPLIQAYGQVFPGALKPLSEMPESLQRHIRYPEGLFDVQAELYRSYHMENATVFYNREDMWDAPRELYGGQAQRMESYYLIMELPGEEDAEFILLRPFVPSGKDNMISWLAARCDTENYGRLVLYQFPKKKLVFGPNQIEARIDQDPEISQAMTLWSQAGSSVVRGNLLVVPVERSLLYVEPLYLQAASGQLPELKRVIVSYEDKIAMEPTLDAALAKVFGAATAHAAVAPLDIVETVDPETGEVTETQVAPQGAAQAQAVYQRAIDAQRAGDWAAYGQAIDELGLLLGELAAEGTE
ncbi:MAG: UPF0182 family protein [Proteobacteria bacterium]|nr:UPF0182 family protein [Pseudomonadota bacterium]MCP4915596.1 UPF0182 family protein [Pseudomonadota bacterium]